MKWIITLVLGLAFSISSVFAHEIRPAIAEVTFSNGQAKIDLVVNAEALLVGIGPQHKDTKDAPQAEQYNALRREPTSVIERRFKEFVPQFVRGIELSIDKKRVGLELVKIQTQAMEDPARARRTHIELVAPLPEKRETAAWRYDARFGSSVVKFKRDNEAEFHAQWLPDGETSAPFQLLGSVIKPDRMQVAGQYLLLGFTHIVPNGLDHILFVLGLFLLSVRWRPLLWQVTAFTVAHSITLGLSIYGVFSLSPAIVEPLIALSIVYVAVENLLTQRLHAWRVFIVFGFGLLHGLGFAGVLTEIGLPRSEFLTGLVAFNVGVEFGQLAVLTLAFVSVGWWGWKSSGYRTWIVVPISIVIATVGLYWAFERL